MKPVRILAVDDEEDIRELLRELLQRAGYDVGVASDGRAGLRAFHAHPADLVILDVTMPELDGWQTLERIRDLSDVPVLMLTARSAELERVRGLRGGGDDYVPKPFGRQELLARVEALLRRTRGRVQTHDAYADDLITIDFAQARVKLRGQDVALTPLEFRLLSAFVRHPRPGAQPRPADRAGLDRSPYPDPCPHSDPDSDPDPDPCPHSDPNPDSDSNPDADAEVDPCPHPGADYLWRRCDSPHRGLNRHPGRRRDHRQDSTH